MLFHCSGSAMLVHVVVLVHVLVLLPGSALAQDTLFVAMNGTGTSCTSWEEACGSIQAAVTVATEGATIRIGPGTYVENLLISTVGVSLVAMTESASPDGAAAIDTAPVIVESAGGIPTTSQVSKDSGTDVVVDIAAPNVTLTGLVIRHADGTTNPTIDLGILVRSMAHHTLLDTLIVERLRRTGYEDPTATGGSRGLLVTRATHVTCRNSIFRGSYQDHISLSTSLAFIEKNIVANATRLGIVILQDPEAQDDNGSIHNVLKENTVVGSASDGIQVQGNNNTIQDNTVSMNGGYGIHFCGSESNPPCVSPGETAVARFNTAGGNFFWDNDLGGEYVQDQGSDNYAGHAQDTTQPEETDTTDAPDTSVAAAGSVTALPLPRKNATQEGTQDVTGSSTSTLGSSATMSSSNAVPQLAGGIVVSCLFVTASFLYVISY